MFSSETLHNVKLPYILSSFRKCRDATDLRDRIYGMLGEHAVAVDYTQSVEQVLATAAIQMISAAGSLDVSSHQPARLRSAMILPSYAPDWTSFYDDLHAHFSWLH